MAKHKSNTDWRILVTERIEKTFHPGRGPDDHGGLKPLALRMFIKGNKDHMDRLMKVLEKANKGRLFDAFDTNEGNGINLCELIRLTTIFSKPPRPPLYDLKKIQEEYDRTTTSDQTRKDLLFNETMKIALLQSIPRRPGNQGYPLRECLIRELHTCLRRKFRHWDTGEAISIFLRIGLGEDIAPGSVNRIRSRAKTSSLKERDALEVSRRLLKVYRGTGTKRGTI